MSTLLFFALVHTAVERRIKIAQHQSKRERLSRSPFQSKAVRLIYLLRWRWNISRLPRLR
jgi:hypothetical protein